MPKINKLNLDWSAVEKALAEGTFSGYKIGILETEKLFARLLKDKKIPGRNIEAQIKYIRNFLSMPDKLNSARSVYKKIIEEPHFEISREETKKVIGAYWQAMIDIEEVIQYLTLWEKFSIRIKYLLSNLIKKLKKIAFYTLFLLLLILFLGETEIGQTISISLVSFAHFLVFNILIWLAAFLIVFYLFRGIVKFVKKMKKTL